MNEDRIQKILANAGLGSRREMEQAIASGKVKINGRTAQLGDKASRHDTLLFNNKEVKREATFTRQVLIYNKPEGEVCSRKDSKNRPTVFQQLPYLPGERWIAIGRLDINTSGLLLFTNDGELANRLMHPSHQIEREYAVRVLGDVSQENIDTMCQGVQLEDGPAKFTDIQFYDGSGSNKWFHVVLLEGRNREVRRIWESQNLTVSRLKRVRYGNVFLESSMRAGTWSELSKKEVNALASLVDLPARPWQSIIRSKHDPNKRKMERQRTRRSVRSKR